MADRAICHSFNHKQNPPSTIQQRNGKQTSYRLP